MHFAKHETFHIRDGWLFKGLRALEDDPKLFLGKDAPERLGIGTNMVRALRFWMQATGLTEEKWQDRTKAQYPTRFGELVIASDPYLELDGTLWLLHYHLASSEDLATTWFWFFNQYAPIAFSPSEFVDRLALWINATGGHKKKIAERSLRKDFDCLVRTYLPGDHQRSPEDHLDSPLSVLGLISAMKVRDENTGAQTQRYRLEEGDLDTIHPLVFLYVLFDSQESMRPGANQVAIKDALREPKNVGRTFNLGMLGLEDMLLRIRDDYEQFQVGITRTGGLDQLNLSNVTSAELLNSYYGEQRWQ